MSEIKRTFTSGDIRIEPKTPTRHKREQFWEWEYWALLEHKAMSRCETWSEYIDKVLNAFQMPVKGTNIEIDDKPPPDTPFRTIIMRASPAVMESAERRCQALNRIWREYLLYPALQNGLVEAHYLDLKGRKWIPRENQSLRLE